MIPAGYSIQRIEQQAAAVSIVCTNEALQTWRRAFGPNDDLSKLPADVQTAITESFTPEMVAAYQATIIQEDPVTLKDYSAAVQGHVDMTAASRGYADGVAIAGYALSTVPAWAAEAQAFLAWRDAVWVYAYTELAKVQSGQRSVPTIAELIAELPTIRYPEAS